ncbi:hypothetical protein JOF40_001538 [Aeromicrobium fastidiosum]|nr:hypothetical protein [Aeromicrobium fastidiosum]
MFESGQVGPFTRGAVCIGHKFKPSQKSVIHKCDHLCRRLATDRADYRLAGDGPLRESPRGYGTKAGRKVDCGAAAVASPDDEQSVYLRTKDVGAREVCV